MLLLVLLPSRASLEALVALAVADVDAAADIEDVVDAAEDAGPAALEGTETGRGGGKAAWSAACDACRSPSTKSLSLSSCAQIEVGVGSELGLGLGWGWGWGWGRCRGQGRDWGWGRVRG